MKETIKYRDIRGNRKYKDSLFRMVFRKKSDLLELYNAINGTEYTNPNELEINTLENVLYITKKNDVSFIIDCTMNLYEHQSSYNPNMPLRGLVYFSKQYNKYEENRENAIKNNGVIKKGPREIIVPQYYKKKLEIKTKQELNQEKAIESLRNYHIKIEKPWKILNQKEREYTEERLKWEKLKLMKIKEETRKAAMERNGEKINIRDF